MSKNVSGFGRFAENNYEVRPVHVSKFPLFVALIKFYSTELKNVAYKHYLTLLGFYFRKHFSLGYFHCCPLSHIYSKLIVENTTICLGGFSNLVVLYCFFK